MLKTEVSTKSESTESTMIFKKSTDFFKNHNNFLTLKICSEIRTCLIMILSIMVMPLHQSTFCELKLNNPFPLISANFIEKRKSRSVRGHTHLRESIYEFN